MSTPAPRCGSPVAARSGPRGGGAGDLYVHLRVAAHERFRREGDDLVTDLPVSIAQAALGAKFMLPTLDGDEEIVVPAGTQPGREFVLRQRGVPRLQGRGRGDLRVRVDVQVPTKLSEFEAELLKKFAESRGEEVHPEQRPVRPHQVGVPVNPALRSSAAHVFVASLAAPELEPDDAHHLFRVLRAARRRGRSPSATVPGGWRLHRGRRRGVCVPTGERSCASAAGSCTIAAAIPKGDRAGVDGAEAHRDRRRRIVLVHCAAQRGALGGRAWLRASSQRLRRVAREAAMQSRRVWLPVVRGPAAVRRRRRLPGAVLADPGGRAGPRRQPCRRRHRPRGRVHRRGTGRGRLPPVGLGDTVLRVETAAHRRGGDGLDAAERQIRRSVIRLTVRCCRTWHVRMMTTSLSCAWADQPRRKRTE